MPVVKRGEQAMASSGCPAWTGPPAARWPARRRGSIGSGWSSSLRYSPGQQTGGLPGSPPRCHAEYSRV